MEEEMDVLTELTESIDGEKDAGNQSTPLTSSYSNQTTPSVLKDGHKIDVLLNCGGIQLRHPSHQFPDNDWNDALQVNLSIVFTLRREIGAHMLARDADYHGRRGSIIKVTALLSLPGWNAADTITVQTNRIA
jgi:NAD(P)-dependent dehydrogenase (short-subunit alcohol dehydrogenase family)